MTVNCEFCHKEFNCSPSRLKKAKHYCCSRECQKKLTALRHETDKDYLNCVCPVCGKRFHLKHYIESKGGIHCCSKDCAIEIKRTQMTGENNHQYGLKGALNSSWKSDSKISVYGYRLIRVLEHPFCNSDGFVFEHRLVVEENWLTPDNSVEIDGKRYLSPELDVHHIDGDRLNNDPDNLFIMTKALHRFIHNIMDPRPRGADGRFLAD